MELKQGPFSLYDFLGYFFPGAVAIYSMAWVLKYLGATDGLYDFAALAKASELLPFILAAYVSGHLCSLASSFTVERYFIWHFDYPSKSLLRYSQRKFFNDAFSLSNIIKFVVWLILFPITSFLYVVCFFSEVKPGMVSQLDPLLAKIIRRKITGLIVKNGQISNPNHYDSPKTSDFFRFVYHFTLEKAPAHYAKMQNYVALFGFNRAMCFVFVVCFWIGISAVLSGDAEQGLRVVLLSTILANFFFFGFAKFYRRFNLESLMALAVTYQIPDDFIGTKLPRPKGGKRIVVGHDLRQKSQFSRLVSDIRRRVRLKKRMSAS